MTRTMPNPWLFIPKPQPLATVRLICFPYAGGSAQIFYPWLARLPDWIELVAVQLPGRSTRLQEPALTTMSDIVQALLPELNSVLNKPYVVFGHSLGATIAFEWLRLNRVHQLKQPALFVPAGRRAPHLPDPDPPTWHLPEPAFIDKLRELNGTPQVVLDNEELMQLVLPALRADFQVAECYQYTAQPALNVPFYVLGGAQDQDNHTQVEMQAWQQHTQADFNSALLPGDHFFIHQDEAEMLTLLKSQLNRFKA